MSTYTPLDEETVKAARNLVRDCGGVNAASRWLKKKRGVVISPAVISDITAGKHDNVHRRTENKFRRAMLMSPLPDRIVIEPLPGQSIYVRNTKGRREPASFTRPRIPRELDDLRKKTLPLTWAEILRKVLLDANGHALEGMQKQEGVQVEGQG